MPAGSSRRHGPHDRFVGILLPAAQGVLHEAVPVEGHRRAMDVLPCLVAGGPEALRLLLHVQGAEPQVGVAAAPLPLLPPLLPGQGGDLLRQVGVVVFKDDAGLFPLDLQAGHRRVVAVAQAVHLAGAQPADGGLEAADGGAVGEQGDGLARVGGGQPEHRLPDPGLHLGKGLPAPHPELRGAVVEADQVQGVLPLQRAPGLVLPHPHADLPQARGGVELQARGPGRWPGRWSWCGTGRWSTPRRWAHRQSGPAGPRSAGSRSR